MERVSAAGLRARRSDWSLADDRRLLALLQDIHERVLSRCAAAGQQLDAMCADVDLAAVSLQNVNNRLFALSNSQFIESRVADDDDVGAASAPPAPAAEVPGGGAPGLLAGLRALEARHEVIELDDSGSDSDDGAPRVILRPRDLYPRPLPHVAGSAQWSDSWHAGLLAHSDSDEGPPGESSAGDESQDESVDESPDESLSSASRGGARGPAQERAPAPESPATAYRPELPYPAPLPRGSPPPPSLVDDDVFADAFDSGPLDRGPLDSGPLYSGPLYSGPYGSGHKEHSPGGPRVGSLGGDSEASRAVSEHPPKSQVAKGESTLFTDKEDSNLFSHHAAPRADDDTTAVKKPVGAISLFGSGAGASIGAAILNRARRGSSTSDEEPKMAANKNTPPAAQPNKAKNAGLVDNKDLVKDLFGKNASVVKKLDNVKDKGIFRNEGPVKVESKKVDLFSDDIFDDLDDIFATKVIVKPDKQKNNGKSLFDDDDDDLFSDIGVTKVDSVKAVKPSKNIFDSDDELFSDTTDKVTSKTFDTVGKIEQTNVDVSESKSTKYDKSESSIFDSDDELFSEKKLVEAVSVVTKPPVINKTKPLFDDDSDDMFFENKSTEITKAVKSTISEKTDIKTEVYSVPSKEIETKESVTDNLTPSDESINKKPSDLTFEVDENITKPRDDLTEPIETHSKNEALFDDDELSHPTLPDVQIDSKIVPEVDSQKFDDHQYYNVNEESIFNTASNVNTNSEDIISNSPINSAKEVLTNKYVDESSEKLYSKNKAATSIDIVSEIVNSSKENIQKEYCSVDDAPIHPPVLDQSQITENKKAANEPSIDTTQTETKEKPLEAVCFEETIPFMPDTAFDDIFSASAPPPILQKLTKEAKKSQNVNALFDDDSDDEALFFKGNDGVVDDKPPPQADKDMFSIFQDEPPAIDFVLNKDVTDCKVEMRADSPIDAVKDVPLPSPIIPDSVTTGKVEKVVGKLKPSALNINVGSLLPGAMPKKLIKEKPQVEPQESKPKESNEPDSKLVKSVSFDSDPDSAVLDNKLSKGRPKIQIKRRPSTRRARIEAVRRSAIDFDEVDAGQDAEANVAFDEKPKDINNPIDTLIATKDNEQHDVLIEDSKKVASHVGSTDTEPVSSFNTQKSLNNELTQKHVIEEQKTTSLNSEETGIKTDVLNINEQDTYVFKRPSATVASEASKENKTDQKINESSQIKDITNKKENKAKVDNENKEGNKSNKQIKNPLFDFDDVDDDDMFNAAVSRPAGKPKPNVTVKTTDARPAKAAKVAKIELFNSASDEESLFGAKSKSTKKSTNAVFSSDSDDELFAPKKSRVLDKSRGNTSLFGDEDDEDLFGGNSSKL